MKPKETPPPGKLVARVPLASLIEGASLRIEYPPYDILVALVDGIPRAIEDACNHAGASLSEGPIDKDCISCPQHGYVFSLLTGKLIVPLGLCDDQRTFITKIEGDDVVIYDDAALLFLR
ncbi:MAG: Rieske 2Fe-2S domain-containing protein [Polyangiaceae bacterium]